MNRSTTAAAHTGAAERLGGEPLPVASPLRVRREAAPPFSLAVLVALAALIGPTALGQPVVRPIIASTVATLPAGASNGAVRLVTDGSAADDCVTGGGTTYVWCVKTGAGWVAFGDGGGGGGTATAGDSATGFFSTGTLEHERGGLEADVSAFGGLLRIAAGSTSAVSTLAGLNAALGSSIADGAHTPAFTPNADPGVDHSGYVAGHGDGTDCSPGSYARGTDGSGNAQGCTADDTGTDSQTATGVPYTPTTGTDWTDPDPTHAGGGLDALAARLTTEEAKADDDVPEDADLGTGTPDGTTFLRGDRTWAVPAGGGGSPAGSGSEIQFRADATTFGAVTGSSVSGGSIGIGIATPASPLHVFGAPGSYGQLNIDSTNTATQVNFALSQGGTRRWVIYTPGGGTDYRIFGTTPNTDLWTLTQTGLATVQGSAAGLAFVNRGGGSTWQWYSTSNVARLYDGTGDRLTVSGTEVTIAVEQVNSPASQTCTDEGTGAAGALTITVSGLSYVALTNADPHGCAVTIGETGASNGQRLEIIVISNAGGTVDFADTSGVTELAGAFAADINDALTLRYAATTWVEISRSAN